MPDLESMQAVADMGTLLDTFVHFYSHCKGVEENFRWNGVGKYRKTLRQMLDRNFISDTTTMFTMMIQFGSNKLFIHKIYNQNPGRYFLESRSHVFFFQETMICAVISIYIFVIYSCRVFLFWIDCFLPWLELSASFEKRVLLKFKFNEFSSPERKSEFFFAFWVTYGSTGVDYAAKLSCISVWWLCSSQYRIWTKLLWV